jgi:hypothetical protein
MGFASFVKSLFFKQKRRAVRQAKDNDMSPGEFLAQCVPGNYEPYDPDRGPIFRQSEMKQGRDGKWRSGADRDRRRDSNRYYPGISDREDD